MPRASVRELDALRRRAYGPGADIERDPQALRRLAQLEAAAHAGADPVSAGEGAGATEPNRRAERGGSVSFKSAATVLAAIIAIVIAASTLPVSPANVVLTPARLSGQDRQDLIDEVDLLSLGMQGAQLRAYERFDDLAVWSAADPRGTACLLVQHADEALRVVCASEPLLPALDLRVGDAVQPDEVGHLPIGSSIRFLLQDQRVEVEVTQGDAPSE